MPMVCSICKHPKKKQINRAIVEGRTSRDIAGQFSVSKTAVGRHREGHLSPQLKAWVTKRQESDMGSLAERMEELYEQTGAILKEARSNKRKQDNGLALRAIARMEKQLGLMGHLLGELAGAASEPGVDKEEWAQLRTTILVELERFPEAKNAVARALAETESDEGGDEG